MRRWSSTDPVSHSDGNGGGGTLRALAFYIMGWSKTEAVSKQIHTTHNADNYCTHVHKVNSFLVQLFKEPSSS